MSQLSLFILCSLFSPSCSLVSGHPPLLSILPFLVSRLSPLRLSSLLARSAAARSGQPPADDHTYRLALRGPIASPRYDCAALLAGTGDGSAAVGRRLTARRTAVASDAEMAIRPNSRHGAGPGHWSGPDEATDRLNVRLNSRATSQMRATSGFDRAAFRRCLEAGGGAGGAAAQSRPVPPTVSPDRDERRSCVPADVGSNGVLPDVGGALIWPVQTGQRRHGIPALLVPLYIAGNKTLFSSLMSPILLACLSSMGRTRVVSVATFPLVVR